jgi:hypothetical protein
MRTKTNVRAGYTKGTDQEGGPSRPLLVDIEKR